MTPAWVEMMARYNGWQNVSIFGAADGLSDAERRKDRGAFFGSIHRTLSHLAWGDWIWISRFDGGDGPKGGIPESADMIADWNDLKTFQAAMDQRILNWAQSLSEGDLNGELSWYSGAMKAHVKKDKMLVFTHFFNHMTHHRGQVHAMLTAAGAKPADTDLFFMPENPPMLAQA